MTKQPDQHNERSPRGLDSKDAPFESTYDGPAGGPAYPSSHPTFIDDPAPSYSRRSRASEAGEVTASDPVTDAGSAAGAGADAAHAAEPADAGYGHPVDEPDFAPSANFAVADGVRDVGMNFIGASMTAGYGDPKGLGWVGRVVARTQHPDLDLTAYNLGVRGNSSADVVARWREECDRRWAGRSEKRLVVSVGLNDVLSGMTMARSRLNLANLIDEASSSGIATFVVGITPTLDQELNRKALALAEAQADVCARRGVTYVDCFRPLVGHDQWMADLAASPDRAHPGQAGYGLIAWLVLHNGWNDWLSIN